MNKGRLIFVTDLFLLPVFVFCFYTGVRLHIAGHASVWAIIQSWAAAHVCASLLFLLLVLLHVKSHWAWYRALKNGCKSRKKMVLFLSIVFVFLSLSGVSLFFLSSEDAHAGLLHYRLGLLFGVLSVLHVLKRRRFFRASRGNTGRSRR